MHTTTHFPRKHFGQNFLQDSSSIAKIITTIAPSAAQHLVEIGPGLGAITLGLLKSNALVDVIELDKDLITPLTKLCIGFNNVRIHQANALKFDICSLINQQTVTKKLRVIGNLPYNISTPLLFHIINQINCIQDLHLLLQKEVVMRMTAVPGNKIYGRLSIMTQVHCTAMRLFDIPPQAFYPAPKVISSFVQLIPHTTPTYTIIDMNIFARVVTQAFSQRRKTLRNALLPLVPNAIIRTCGLDDNLRPEQLTVQDFVNLTNALHNSLEYLK